MTLFLCKCSTDIPEFLFAVRVMYVQNFWHFFVQFNEYEMNQVNFSFNWNGAKCNKNLLLGDEKRREIFINQKLIK